MFGASKQTVVVAKTATVEAGTTELDACCTFTFVSMLLGRMADISVAFLVFVETYHIRDWLVGSFGGGMME